MFLVHPPLYNPMIFMLVTSFIRSTSAFTFISLGKCERMGAGSGKRQVWMVSRRLCGDAADLDRRQEKPSVGESDEASLLPAAKIVAAAIRAEQYRGGGSCSRIDGSCGYGCGNRRGRRGLVGRDNSGTGGIEGIAATTAISRAKCMYINEFVHACTTAIEFFVSFCIITSNVSRRTRTGALYQTN